MQRLDVRKDLIERGSNLSRVVNLLLRRLRMRESEDEDRN